jgi:hypothetical protein
LARPTSAWQTRDLIRDEGWSKAGLARDRDRLVQQLEARQLGDHLERHGDDFGVADVRGQAGSM